ncbi:MAG: PilZ domain-containing protein [Myxococcales bacterium]|nr:PilZ domain-containing protein [Myxococcales bacterium]
MITSDDARWQQLLELADLAIGNGLMDFQRPIWRDLVTQLLGSVRDDSGERRKDLRAPLELEVDILAPEEIASLATSSVSAGGLSIRIAEVIPVGTRLDLSIKLAQRPVPLLAKAQVVWSREGELGVAFVDLFQNDRELLEGLAVKAVLSGPPT